MSEQAYTRSERLKCGLCGLQVMDADTLAIIIPRLHSPDMTGAIELAKAVMPDVSAVYVFNERIHSDNCETVYKLTRYGVEPPQWEAFDTRKTAR